MRDEAESRYPLAWPTGWKRTPPESRRRSLFRHGRDYISIEVAKRRLVAELDRLGAAAEILSTNIELRLDGMPRSNRPEPRDVGVALYFNLAKRRVVLACDKWDRVADNIAAVAAHIDALRAQERWGVGSIEQAFGGYLKIEAPETIRNWRNVLGLQNETTLTPERINERFRELASIHHPDKGGNPRQMSEILDARREALRELQTR